MCVNIAQEYVQDGEAFSLIQPGSSVATALSEGESKKKHVVLFEINADKYRTVNYPLESVRPFVHDNVSCTCPLCACCTVLLVCRSCHNW